MFAKHLTKEIVLAGALFLLMAGSVAAVYPEAENNGSAVFAAAAGESGGAIINTVTIEGGAFSSPAVSGGNVYIGTLEGDVLCFNAVTGRRIWEFETTAEVNSSPVVSGGKVYVGGYDGNVYCLDAGSGSKIWSAAAGDLVGSSPAVYGGNIYAGSYFNNDKKNKTVFCLNALTGNRIWAFATDSDVESSPAVADGYVYIGSSDNKIYCLTADAGKKVWDFTTGGIVVSSPAVTAGRVYAGSFDGRLYCLDALTGRRSWDFNTGKSIVFSSPALANGFVYTMNTDGTLYCLDAETGAKQWEFATYSVELYSSPAVTGKYIYLKNSSGIVYCLNALTGAEVWKSALGETENLGSSPAIAGGCLYVGGEHLYYLAAAADETGSWPLYRYNPERTGALTAPDALFTAVPVSGNAPLAVTFTDASTGAINTWAWDFGDGAKSSEQNPQHTFNTAGIYSVSLTVSGPGGDDTFSRISGITVSQNAPKAQFSADVTSGTAPLKARFTDTSTGTITAYQWNFGDGSSSAGKNPPQHTYSNPGTYTVALRVNGPEGADYVIKQDYITVAAAPSSFSLSGTVSGDRRAGVTLFLNGSQQQVVTGADGTYSFAGLTAGTYLIAPFKSATVFNPASREVKVQSKDIGGVDFIAKPGGPEITEAYASRTEVPADSTTPVIFFAQVTHPQGMQSVSSVTINLSAIGRGAGQQMNDEGTFGDQTAGDGIYSLQTTVATGIGPQLAGLVVTAVDTQNQTASASISVSIINSFSGDLGTSGDQSLSIINQITNQTLNFGFGGGHLGDMNDAFSTLQVSAACFPLLQILQPNGTQYGEKLPITDTKAEISIPNAAQGIWKCIITNECSDNKKINLSVSSSGTGLVSGTVIDGATGAGVPGAAIDTDAGVTAAAADDGFYTFISPAGSFTIEASDDTLGSAAKSALLEAGEMIEVNLALGTQSSDGGCAASSMLPGEKANLNLLRLFRDRVLKKTDAGAQYVRLYYQHGPEVVRLLDKDPALKKELRACLVRALPLVISMSAGAPLPVSAQQREEIAACLQKVAMRGSAALKADADTVLARIQDQSIFKELGTGSAKRAAR